MPYCRETSRTTQMEGTLSYTAGGEGDRERETNILHPVYLLSWPTLHRAHPLPTFMRQEVKLSPPHLMVMHYYTVLLSNSLVVTLLVASSPPHQYNTLSQFLLHKHIECDL